MMLKSFPLNDYDFWHMCKDEATSIMNNAALKEKKGSL